MAQKTLAAWLDYQQRIHPRDIELGLERVRDVWRRMGAPSPAPVLITVGGTNGKGSTVAFLQAMLKAAGKRVGAYTSPHLLSYDERVQVDGSNTEDAMLVDAFERIETARNEVQLTYFEFGTLAALWIFAHANLDVALLEVGLGGRLDAVNIIDADAAIVTSVDLDHMEWLGDDREAIGREKAGIFRAGRPAIIAFQPPPDSVLAEARRIGALPILAGIDYRAVERGDGWQWQAQGCSIELPRPGLAAPCQMDNAAAAIAALHALRDRLGWNPRALATGVAGVHAAARLQRFGGGGEPELVIDVGHNPQAARALRQWLVANPPKGRNLVVYGALADKDVAGVVAAVDQSISSWFAAGLDAETPRGLPVAELLSRMTSASGFVRGCTNVEAALDAAFDNATADDRILAFGSFFVAAAALNKAQQRYADRSAGR